MDKKIKDISYWKERYDIEREEVVALGKRVKELEKGIERHKVDTWKLVNKINHPIIDADIELYKLVEPNQNKSLDFLDDKEEDIYAESDGVELEKKE